MYTRNNNTLFVDKRVYHCPCVAFEIKLCLINGNYSLKDIVSNLNEKVNSHRKIYCSKCGNNEVIFSCRKHMTLTFLLAKSTKHKAQS